MRISFPAYESIFSFQPDNLLSSFSLRAWKVFFFDLPTKDGSPRYVSCCFMTSAPKHCFISSCMSYKVLWLKNNEVFLWLIFWPDACSYVSKICTRWSQSSLVAWQKIILLSVKKRCEICGPYGEAATPLIDPIDVAL